MSEIVEDELATKHDLQILESNFDGKLQTLGLGLEKRIQNVELNMERRFQIAESRMEQLEYRLTIKLGTLMIIGITTMATLMKFWMGN